MKRFLIIFFLSTIPLIANTDSISGKLQKIICQTYHNCDQYTDEQILEISKLLDKASMIYQVSIYKLFALIAIESGFDRYHSYKNTNGSVDIGLMQSNSDHIPERCKKLLNRNCDYSELIDPVISVKLAFYRFNECAKYKNDAFFVCYNNEYLAYKYLTTDYYPEYLTKLYVEYNVIVKELLK